MTTRTHHICFGGDLGCSGANPCAVCRATVEKHVIFWSWYQMVLRGLMTEDQARMINSLYEEGWRNLHDWMARDPEIASRSLDLSRIRIDPVGTAPPAVANVPAGSGFPFFPPLPSEPGPPVRLREVPFSFPVPPAQAPPPPEPPIARPVATVAAPPVPAAPVTVEPRTTRTEMSAEDVALLAVPVPDVPPPSPADIADGPLNGAARAPTT